MKKEWIQLENVILEHIKMFDSYAKRTPGSGNKGRKGDIVTQLPLHIECKQRNKKNIYQQDWYDKCKEEVPLHSIKTPIIITENKDKQQMVHLSFKDFWAIFTEWYNLKNEK